MGSNFNMLIDYLINSIVTFLILMPIAIVIILIKNTLEKRKGLRANYFLDFIVALFIIYLIIIALLTLMSMPLTNGNEKAHISLIPFNDILSSLIGGTTTNPLYTIKVFLANIILFIPFGFL